MIARKAPWWLISVGMHLLLIIILLFIIAFVPFELISDLLVMDRPGKPNFKVQSNMVQLESSASSSAENEVEITKPTPEEVEETIEIFEEKEATKVKKNQFKPKSTSVNKKVTHKGTGIGNLKGLMGKRMGPGKNKGLISGGGNTTTERGVKDALNWLARHQNSDGSWSIQGCTKHCGKGPYKRSGKCTPTGTQFEGDDEYSVGATGLALLAFLGAGYAPGIPGKPDKDGINYATVVKKGLKYLMRIQDADGRIGGQTEHMMYNHVISALAIVEAFDITQLGPLRDSAHKAVAFVIKAQNEEESQVGETNKRKLAWRYEPKSGDNDSSVTGWISMLLKAAENAKIPFTRAAYGGISRWYKMATDEETGVVGYNRKWGPRYPLGAFIRGVNGRDRFEILPSCTAIAIMGQLFMKKRPATLDKSIKKMMEFIPSWKDDRTADFYYWYNATYALYQYYKSSDANWSKWNTALKAALLPKQVKGAGVCEEGSWKPVTRWSCKGGRLATTALGALILEVYYRYGKVK